MKSASVVALVALLAQDARHPESSAGPRRAIAGIPGFQAVSRLDVDGTSRRLTAVYVFPDRVRWYLEGLDPDRPERLYLYRQGGLVHRIAGGTRSEPLIGPERESVLMEMELRRAAMLWPDGFDWSPLEGAARSAKVYVDSCCRRGELGTLVASPIVDGRPQRIEARFADGASFETIEIRAWRTAQDRTWPLALAVHSDGQDFTESVESIDTRVHFLDLSFLPADKRAMSASSGSGPAVIARDVVPMTFASHDLSPGISWEAALDRARSWIAEAQAALEPERIAVDPVATFELDAAGRPVRCLVRLATACTPPPAGFRTLAERAGLFMLLPDVAAVNADVVKGLLRAAPPDVRTGIPYLRVHVDPRPQIEVVLPLEPD